MLTKLIIVITMLINVQISPNIYRIIEDIESVATRDIIITSNYRSKKYNKYVGGHPNSKHLCGKAVDIRIRHLTQRQLIALYIELSSLEEYNVVVEHDHIHMGLKEDC